MTWIEEKIFIEHSKFSYFWCTHLICFGWACKIDEEGWEKWGNVTKIHTHIIPSPLSKTLEEHIVRLDHFPYLKTQSWICLFDYACHLLKTFNLTWQKFLLMVLEHNSTSGSSLYDAIFDDFWTPSTYHVSVLHSVGHFTI